MYRIWHYVKGNENNETLHQCIFVDTETDETRPKPDFTGYVLRFGWACYVRRNLKGEWMKPEWKRFTDYQDFWLWVAQKTHPKKKTWVWCHNGAFDYPTLHAFTHLPDTGWNLEKFIIDSPPLMVRYRSGTKSLVLCDTLNIWRMSLAELGKKCGLEKLEMPDKWGAREQDDAYCIRDVDIIRKSVCEWADFLRDNDLGGFSPTIASQAMRTFRHRYLKDRILIENNPVSLTLARNCYHGGRCEAGYIGKLTQPVHSVDMNSMYPYIMSYAEMPLRIAGVTSKFQPHHLAKMLKEYCLCAHVSLDTKEPFAAVVRDNKLCFPTGRFEAYLSSPEIEYALQIDAIREVHLCASYEKGVPFKVFALELYDHKERAARAGLKFEADHWKKLLNSFYGKWGQNGRKWETVALCDRHIFDVRPCINAQTLEKTLRRRFGGQVLVRAEQGESSESHPAIAGHITAHARMVLWTLIRKVSPEDYFYCDTDGLLVSEKGVHALADCMDQFQLGRVKHVETFSEVEIYGCKDLVLDGKEKIKGISKKADCLDKGRYRQLRWHSLAGLLHTGGVDMPLTSNVTKSLRRVYTKGTVLPSGFVVPLHLEEW
jgi:hypothetical protein